MTMISKGALGVCAGVAGALVVGYCIYFDKKRRSDPSFRRKLREKRRTGTKSGNPHKNIKWPDLKDPDSIQTFFLEQVQIGESMMAQGAIEEGVEHLSRAVAVCGQPQQLLSVLQQTLPPQVFQMLLQSLPSAGRSIMEAAGENEPRITEEELE